MAFDAQPAAASYVAYFRVSTDKQGRSGLGLEDQRATVLRHIAREGAALIGEFVEVESGKRADRPQLAAALAEARAKGAVLIVAKLDRLTRDVRFLLSVVEGTGDAGVRFCDLPDIPAGPVGKFMVTMLAAVAELERGMIGQRTKGALAAAKARGVKLGNPQLRAGTSGTARKAREAHQAKAKAKAADILPYALAARKAGATTLAQIGAALEARGVRTPRGGTQWAPAQVARVMAHAQV